MRATPALYMLVAGLTLVELAGCGGDDSDTFFEGSAGEDAGSKAGSGSGGTGASGGSTTGGTAGDGGAAASAGSGEAGTAGSAGTAGTDDAGSGGSEAGPDPDGSVDAAGAAGTSGGTAGSGGVSTSDAAPDANCPQPTVYFKDSDGDTFGDARSSVKACQHLAGYVTNDDDCYDGNADAKPGQTGWFPKHRGDGSYDYDCNGTGVRRWTGTGSCTLLTVCSVFAGWQGSTIPNCGDQGNWITACNMFPLCQAATEPRSQECH